MNSNKPSKGPLSPIDSQNVNKQVSKTSDELDKTLIVKPEVHSPSILAAEPSDQLNLLSINSVCSNMHDSSQYFKPKEEAKEDTYSMVHSSCGSFTHPVSRKKHRKKLDPEQERKKQNFECYKEFIKLKTIYTLIEKELRQVKADNEKYEEKLSIMTENKERHEDDLGYYLGIEDNRKKRVRRLATEIERKHKCLVPKCPKAYGSEGSLNQHLIRKHPMVYEEWIKRITEKEQENAQKKNQISREEKNQIRRDIEKIAVSLCADDDSNFDDSD